MSINVAITPCPAAAGDRRAAPRFGLALSGMIQSDEGTIEAQLENISREGFLLRADVTLPVGTQFSVELPGSPSRKASVKWCDGVLHGCLFEHSIAQAALSAARLRSAPNALDFVANSDAAIQAKTLIGEILSRSNMNRIQLAEALNVSRPALWAWEKGQTAPRRKNLERLRALHAVQSMEDSGAQAPGTVLSDDLQVALRALVAIYRDHMGLSEDAVIDLVRSVFNPGGQEPR